MHRQDALPQCLQHRQIHWSVTIQFVFRPAEARACITQVHVQGSTLCRQILRAATVYIVVPHCLNIVMTDLTALPLGVRHPSLTSLDSDGILSNFSRPLSWCLCCTCQQPRTVRLQSLDSCATRVRQREFACRRSRQWCQNCLHGRRSSFSPCRGGSLRLFGAAFGAGTTMVFLGLPEPLYPCAYCEPLRDLLQELQARCCCRPGTAGKSG